MSESTDLRLANVVGALSLALSDRLREATEAAAGETGAAPAALVALREFLGGRSMDELRRVVGLTPSGAVRLVDRLVAAGYVERRPGRDGRSVALVLTSNGRSAANKVVAARADAIGGALVALSDDERASLTRITERLLSAVTRERLARRETGQEPGGGWLCRLCDFVACGRDRGVCPAATTAAGDDE